MAELRKTGANEYDVVVGGEIIGRVWNWHGSWSAEAGGNAHHGDFTAEAEGIPASLCGPFLFL